VHKTLSESSSKLGTEFARTANGAVPALHFGSWDMLYGMHAGNVEIVQTGLGRDNRLMCTREPGAQRCPSHRKSSGQGKIV